MSLCIFSALPFEISLLKESLGAEGCEPWSGVPELYRARIGSSTAILACVGVGMASSAMAIGCVLSRVRPRIALMVGSAGCLPGSGLRPGDLIVSSEEIFAELGALIEGSGTKLLPLDLPGLEREIPLDPALSDSILEAGSRLRKTLKGRAITVAGVSGDRHIASLRASAFGALSENMEGYALALAGRAFSIPVAEIRGISNEAGDRNKESWDLAAAVEAAQLAVRDYLRSMVWSD